MTKQTIDVSRYVKIRNVTINVLLPLLQLIQRWRH